MQYTDKQAKIIRDAVEKIKASEGFVNSLQLQNFLSFVVEKTLAGESETIKGYTIGVDALGRAEDFDPTSDPSVRVMAGRLRQSLVNYFNETETPSPVNITLKKGSYVPVIEFLEYSEIKQVASFLQTGDPITESEKSNATRVPSWGNLAILITGIFVAAAVAFHIYYKPERELLQLPVAHQIPIEETKLPSLSINIKHDPTDIPSWITYDEVLLRTIIAFSRFKEYRVFDVSAESSTIIEKYNSSDYALDILFTKANHRDELEVFVRLKQSVSGKIVWSNEFVFGKPIANQEIANQRLIDKTVTELMSPYGVIYRDIAEDNSNQKRLACIRQIYTYFMRESLQAFSDGLACGNALIETGTASSSMYAFVSFLYVEAYRRNYDVGKVQPLEIAKSLADKAVELDPTNARSFQARFAVEKTFGSAKEAKNAAKEALKLNPIDRDIAGDIAAYFIARNEIDTAEHYLKRAMALTPVPPGWLNFYNYLFHDLSGNFQVANSIANRLEAEQSSLVGLAILLSIERGNQVQRQQETIAAIRRFEPELLINTKDALLRKGFSSELAQNISDRIRSMDLGHGEN